MRHEWDEHKSAANLRKHGIGFEAMEAFDWELARLDKVEFIDGEEREAHIAPIGARLYTVIVTERADRLRIISLRRADNVEISRWRQEFHE